MTTRTLRAHLLSCLPVLAAVAILLGSGMDVCAVDPEPRLVVMTDIGGDPDDEQSIVRFLLYACEFDVEGLCTGFGSGHRTGTRPDLLHKAVDAYVLEVTSQGGAANLCGIELWKRAGRAGPTGTPAVQPTRRRGET